MHTGYAQGLLAKVTREVQGLMCKYGPPAEVGEGDQFVPSLVRYVDHLRTEEIKRAVNRKRRQWRNKILNPEGGPSGIHLSRAVRGSSDLLLQTIRDPTQEGGSTLGIQASFDALDARWDPIHTLPCPDHQEWLELCRRHLPEPRRVEIEPINAARIAEHLKRMRPKSARGAEGWAISELQDLPHPALVQLAMFYAGCERHGTLLAQWHPWIQAWD